MAGTVSLKSSFSPPVDYPPSVPHLVDSMLPSDGCPETVSRVQIMVMHYERARRDLASAAAVPHARIGGYACPRLIVGGWQLSAGHSAGRSATPAADLATAAPRGHGPE